MRYLRHALALTAKERSVLLKAVPMLLAVRIALWVVPFRKIHRRWARMPAGRVKPAPANRLPPARITWLVTVASRVVPRAHCLTRSIVAQSLLAREGYLAEVRIGVRRTGDGLDAHAWLEHDGKPLFEDPGHLDTFSHFGTEPVSPRTLADPAK